MSRCIQLAKNGLGSTYPNPLVGAVVVHEDTIIGEGWHYQAGMPHAEVNAINSVKDTTLLSTSSIYVSLEPCSHFGKTPPCSDLIIERGITHVIIGSNDPNPKVAGKGIKKLRAAGCKVDIGVLGNECAELNKRFFTFHQKERPYVILKWAETQDQFIAPKEANRDSKKEPTWITNTYSRQHVHKLRAEEQAILIGTNTALRDNPSLTTRDWFGSSPVRVVLDRNLKITDSLTIKDGAVNTIIFTEQIVQDQRNLMYKLMDFNAPGLIEQLCAVLYQEGIQSIIVEGGAITLQSFIDSGIWDEAMVYRGNRIFKEGIIAPIIKGSVTSEEKLKGDLLQIYKNEIH